jgi:hypothetical protein
VRFQSFHFPPNPVELRTAYLILLKLVFPRRDIFGDRVREPLLLFRLTVVRDGVTGRAIMPSSA